MDESRFWALIETAWQSVGGKPKARQKLAEERLSEDKAEDLLETLEDVMPALQEQLDLLSADDLL